MAKRKLESDARSSKRRKLDLLDYSDSDSDSGASSHKAAPQKVSNDEEEDKQQQPAQTMTDDDDNEQSKNYFGYTNEENPFHDPQLTSLFIWKKKYALHGLKDKDIKKLQKQIIAEKRQILQQEITKTKQRREQREHDKELEERMHAELAREQELEENAGWQEKEELFHQVNAIKRSQIRICENRWRAIDILAVNIIQFALDAKHVHKIMDPIQLIDELSIVELQELVDDMRHYMEDKLIGDDAQQQVHWEMALVYTQHALQCKQLLEMSSSSSSQDVNNNNNTLTESDLQVMMKIERDSLRRQTHDQLLEFEALCSKMVTGRAAEIDANYANISVDVNYWTLALKIAKICKAKTCISEQHRRYLQRVKQEKREQDNSAMMRMMMPTPAQTDSQSQQNDKNDSNEKNDELLLQVQFSVPELQQREKIRDEDEDIPLMDASHAMYASYAADAVDLEAFVDEVDAMRVKVLKQSMRKLHAHSQSQAQTKRKTIASTNVTTAEVAEQNISDGKKKKKTEEEEEEAKSSGVDSHRDTEMYDREAKRVMGDGEHAYNASEYDLPLPIRNQYLWHDKYRARKPRYFNRVKTGYSWNKYNQTHYDPDNPPPKIVQGYKFNIFYPDLIDSSKTPTYKVYEKQGDDEYAILVFHAGPPYQDIAFKVVNNEWEPAHDRGFRCRFEKGIFSLYFNFQRYRYRR